MARAEVAKRVEAESRAHDIQHIMDRWPESLSGGEQQLAQIARALVRAPRVLLMDEPLAKLDIRIRSRLRRELIEMQRGYGVTLVYASNRPEEIMTMPDRLIALDSGTVVQTGTPTAVRARPSSLAIAELTGPISRLAVTIEADTDGYWISGDGVRLRAWAPVLQEHIAKPVTLAARAEHVRIDPSGSVTMTVGTKTLVESRDAVTLESAGGVLHSYETDLVPGAEVSLVLDRWLLFNEAGRLLLSFPS